MEALRSFLKQEIGSISDMTACEGGDISRSYQVTNDRGQKFFLKLNQRDRYEMFESEAKGLAFLADRTRFRVPKVMRTFTLSEESGLLMEWIDRSNPDEGSWRKFWEYLSDMHSVSGPGFGFEFDNFIGPLEQQNTLEENWIEFWIERRISPLVSQAHDLGHLKTPDLMTFIQLFETVRKNFGSHHFQPRLLHGDLWGGNIMFDEKGEPTLIDPAVYFGWPEMELAFMNLFGGFVDTYNSGYQPDVRHEFLGENSYPLWQIYPLLVHTILFGGMYPRRLMTAVRNSLG